MKTKRGILAKRSLRPKKIKRIASPDTQKEIQCSRCKTILPDYLSVCPECGNDEMTAFVEVNPYGRLPMESLIKFCGHLLWMFGIFGFFVFVWQMDSDSSEVNRLYLYAALGTMAISILISAAFFSLSEIMRRVLRIQRRLKFFHEHYNETHPVKHIWKTHKHN